LFLTVSAALEGGGTIGSAYLVFEEFYAVGGRPEV